MSTKPKKTPCPKCGNPLRLLADQLGEEIRCPKCNATFTVGRPQDQVAQSSSAAESDEDAYEPVIPLEPVRLGAPEQLVEIGPGGGIESEYEVDWSTTDDLEMEAPVERPAAEQEQYLESARRRGMIRDEVAPDPPKWTFFSGVFGYPWRGVNLTRWTAMSFGLSISGMMAFATVQLLGLGGGALSQSALQGILMALCTIPMMLAALSFSAASCQAAIQDTADGHDVPQDDSLPEWDHWAFTFLAWLCLWGAAGATGYPLSLLIGPAAFLIHGIVLFPVLVLSAMEADSFLLPFSLPVLRSLGYYWYGWLMFYLLTTALLAAWIVLFDLGVSQAPYLTLFFSGPVQAALLLIYARLLGRVAWRASGTPAPTGKKKSKRAATVDPAAETSAASEQPAKRKKKRTRLRIEIPDTVESPDDPPPAERPRINFHHR